MKPRIVAKTIATAVSTHRVEERDQEDIEIGGVLAVVDQLLRDLKTGRARQEREAGVDVEPRDVGDDIRGDPDEEGGNQHQHTAWIANARHASVPCGSAKRARRGGRQDFGG